MNNTEIYIKIDEILLHMPDYMKDFVQEREDKDRSSIRVPSAENKDFNKKGKSYRQIYEIQAAAN